MGALADLRSLVAKGESATLELKRSTGELRETMQTLCAFANGKGGRGVVGVKPSGEIVGQQVSEQTFHEIAAQRDRFEPPLELEVGDVDVAPGRSALVFSVAGARSSVPFTFDSRAFERVGNTTRRMAQERYEALLLERAHSRRRWENQEADELSLKDIDREEVLRIVGIIRSMDRLSGPIGKSLPDVLDRLGLRKDGKPLRAAVVLFGKTFLPAYPQCELRLARFRGVDKAEFLDQRQLRGPALKLLEEAEIFCQRHFPMPAKIIPNQMRRVEAPLIPPDAMREILVNALIHRNYSIAGGSVSLAIFDDRVEVWSAGRYPSGITPESLTRAHLSVQRNPIIADVFHRAGLVEKWGRGTNRVAEMCAAAGIEPPVFAEFTGAVVVTFRVNVARTAVRRGHATGEVAGEVTGEVVRLLLAFGAEPATRGQLQQTLGLRHEDHFRTAYLVPALERGLVEMTIADKPRSRLQKYRLTTAGRGVISESRRR